MLVLMLCTSMVGIHAEQEKAIGLRAKAFTLEDQFEREWAWNQHWHGKPTVLVLSDWRGSDYTTRWTEPLTTQFSGRVQFVPLADVSLAPSFLKGYLRKRFREAFSYPILLDWDGDVVQHYRIQAGLPNVLFIDANGTVRLHTWGKGSADHIRSVSTEIERLLTK